MAYTTNVTLLDTEGGASNTLDVTARIWMIWFTSGTGSGSGNQQQEEGVSQGLVNKGLSSPLRISFPGPTNFAYALKGVGLSIQDTNRIGSDTGWLFRSGEFSDDLPADQIEIVTGSRIIPSTEVPAMLPALPFTADPGTTTVITGMTTRLAAGGIDFVATGTTRATGVVVSFTYTGRLILSPSSDIRAASSEAINVGISNPVIAFAPGPSILSAIEASLMNFLRVFIMHEFQPRIRQTLENRVNAAIATAMGRALAADGSLPAGVTLSIRSVNVTAAQDGTGTIQVRGALGAYGGVISKFPQTTGGGQCFIATAAVGRNSQEVRLLRDFRDNHLLRSRAGRMFVSIYENVSPPLARMVARSMLLRNITRRLIVEPAAFLVQQYNRRATGSKSHTKRG
jgi:hypothetical protein